MSSLMILADSVSKVNVPAIFIANILGLLGLAMVIFNYNFDLHHKNYEKIALLIMCLTTITACIADPLCSVFDGRSGDVSRHIVYIANLWLFLAVIVFGTSWIFFTAYHIKGKVNQIHRICILSLDSILVILLIINFFNPIIFGVNENNEYFRGSLYYIFAGIEIVYVLDGVVVFLISKFKGGILKFFPVLQFIIPVSIGIAIQMIFYGVSTIWPSFAISTTGVIISLQNENIYRDSLTGLYNRFYLDRLKAKIVKSNKGQLTAFMLDLNGFKEINDKYGHKVGDEALIDAGNLIKSSVGSIGSVMRYAGDEFVILVNAQNTEKIKELEAAIKLAFVEFNESHNKQYTLSVAIGYSKLDLKVKSIDDLLNEVDMEMYRDKKRYYEDIENNRRKN